MIIAVDFDGTIVKHKFPEIGEPKLYAFKTLKRWQACGHKLILWTCRNDVDPALNGRKVLTEAIEFCKANGLEFDAINENLPNIGFNCTPKVYADVYVDDRSIEQLGYVSWQLYDIMLNDVEKAIEIVKHNENERLQTTK